MLQELDPQQPEMPLTMVEIDLSQAPVTEDDGTVITIGDDGSITVDLDGAGEEGAGPDVSAHDANLAEALDLNQLARIAQDLIEKIEADIESRKEWDERFARGVISVGLAKDTTSSPAFPGASDLVYPMLMEATVQFQARAMEELMPSNGPVKTMIVGKSSPEVEAQSERVEAHMNYQIQVEDKGYFDDMDQMLFYLPFGGSAFKKTWDDPIKKMTMSRFVKGNRVHVPYLAASLYDSPRVTHEIDVSQLTMQQMIRAGVYLDANLPEPEETPATVSVVVDEVDSKAPVVAMGEGMHVVYETRCFYDLPGDLADPDGIARPYKISIDKVNQRVLEIRRNWREGDADMKPRDAFSHYKFLPGLGFYGYGWFHTIGGLGDAASGTLNAILDAAAFSTLQGGFKSKEAKLEGKDTTLEPGVYKDCNMTAEELSKAFYTPPFKEPSPALFQALNLMVEIGRRFSMTTDAAVGDGNNTGPVGTTVALIEQSGKLLSGIHKRLHNGFGHELGLRAELNGEHLPDQYPFKIQGEETHVLRADYDDRVDVIPVSDPNISSNTQRIAIAQTVLQLSQQAPGLYDQRKVHEGLLKAMKAPNYEEYLKNPAEIKRADPVSEAQMLMNNIPVKVFPDQDHDAHMMVHQAFMQTVAGTPMEQVVGGPMMAHMADHMGQKFRNQISKMIGVPLPALDAEGNPQQMEPQIENMIAVKAAMVLGQQQGQQPQQKPDPEAAAMIAEQQRKDAETKAKIERDDKMADAKIARDDKLAAAEVSRSMKQDAIDNDRQDRQEFIDMQREGNSAP